MNTTGPHIDECEWNAREWQAQERALREARDNAGLPAGDDMALQYRLVADALRQPPAQGLPADFAHRVAMRVAERDVPAGADARLEHALLRGLAIVLALSGPVALAFFGAPLAAQLLSALGSEGVGWGLALGACVAMSWAFDWLRRRLDRPGNAPQAA